MKKYKVILDTNIYDASNYSFDSPQFSLLKKYAIKGRISLLINSVIRGEVEKHIHDRIKLAVKEVNETLGKHSRDFTSFKYNDIYKSRLQMLDRDSMIEWCIKQF